MKTKNCTKCKIRKEITNFYTNESGKFGVRSICKKCTLEHRKLYYKTHFKERAIYYQNNKKDISKKNKIFYKKNKSRLLQKSINYNKSHKNEKAAYMRKKRNTDIRFNIASQMRTRIFCALKKNKKILSTMLLIGCEIDYLMYYLQNKFKNGMTWNNYGRSGWVIDHIRPCASFNLRIKSEQLKCFNYKNLQPLWNDENRKKLSDDFKLIRKYKNGLYS